MMSCRRGSSVGIDVGGCAIERIAFPQAMGYGADVGNARPLGAQRSDVPARGLRSYVL